MKLVRWLWVKHAFPLDRGALVLGRSNLQEPGARGKPELSTGLPWPRIKPWLLLAIIALPISAALVSAGPAPVDLERLAREAISPEATMRAPAIAALRAQGPTGLQALLQAHADILARHAGINPLPAAGSPDEAWLRLKAALDAVGGQRDCYASKLYWYTDLAQAKEAARASGRPILSLRLLGRLDEELSCANSRFFRTTLYSNAEVSRYLGAHFVLHWKSVRPVPRVTIDFGDGRKIERTITGNSIHYVLDAQGRVLDAMPGLYGAQAFLNGLQRAEEIARRYSASDAAMREYVLREYHRSRLAALRMEWANDLAEISPPAPALTIPAGNRDQLTTASPPSAQAAARVAVSKGGVEVPLLRAVAPKTAANPTPGEFQPDDQTWAKIAALHAGDVRLDEGSKALLRTKSPSALDAGRLALSKRQVEDPLLRALRKLERSIAEDTVRNEYGLHARIHEWFASGLRGEDVEALNSKVYAELFLTPESDPWLGLVPPDTCTALENDGLVTAGQP